MTDDERVLTDLPSRINDNTNINPKAKFTIYDSSSHDAWTATYNPVNNTNDIYSWMLQYNNQRTHLYTTTSKATGGQTTDEDTTTTEATADDEDSSQVSLSYSIGMIIVALFTYLIVS